MKKIIRFTTCLFFAFSASYGQKELWGYSVIYNYLNPETAGVNDGMIIKTALEGTAEPEILHTFDATGILGKFPRGRLFQASNGKLYGVTGYDGYSTGPGAPLGVLFEYDLVLDRYKVLSTSLVSAQQGVIEPLPGILYGTTNAGNSIYKYNIETEEMSIVASIPSFTYNNSNMFPKFLGELMKASDGNLYGVTGMAPSSQNTPYPGGIYKLNLASGQISKVFVFGVTGDVVDPMYESKLVEGLPGKLYGTALGGLYYGPQGVAPSGSGTLYEFTIATSTLVKKFDFDFNTIGSYPSPIIKSGDNKLYGAICGLSVNPNNYPNADGSIYEYDPATGTMNILHAFVFYDDDLVKTPSGLMTIATNGKLYGSSYFGTYQYDIAIDSVSKKIDNIDSFNVKDVIEICRKPSYHFFDTSAFIVCENTAFEFDIKNTNATSYIWKRGSTVLPLQATAILSLTNPTPADTGIYTCTMVNECGTTVTMPLQLTVENCLGVDEAIGLKNAITLYPNPATSTLNVSLPKLRNFEIGHIAISNMLGQIVYDSAGKETAIHIGNLNPGVYQLLLSTDKGDWNGRFIKQ